ncbi:MAG: AmmeMemoRadiSam system radical SAM enzyme [Kiritimatiellae bacterium]|jgi:pyruvate formate lyase activating enzyme|nr:AmmeMemoRadiSam system radical SAM enzyme [Kiritimatiellia bacterium]
MKIKCKICPKMCLIALGENGDCKIRFNLDGEIKPITYGHPCSINVEPIEKKPLFHFLPGSSVLSLATFGCNLHCKNCQNWQISQNLPDEMEKYPELLPEGVAPLAKKYGCESVAYTYTDPTAFYEYALDCSIKVHEAGLKNVLVSAGYINKEPWKELCKYTDAANIDLKSMSNEFYKNNCGVTLQPVLDALVIAKENLMLEVTNLVIPTLNDTDEQLMQLAKWIKENLGEDTPLHFSQFFPQYKMMNLPPTPPETLKKAKQIAEAEGLLYVYIGNISTDDGENTYCPECKREIIERSGYVVKQNNLKSGKCKFCEAAINGVW